MSIPRVISFYDHKRCTTGGAEGRHSIVAGIPLSEGHKSNLPPKHPHGC
jgi:hypothetical protein